MSQTIKWASGRTSQERINELLRDLGVEEYERDWIDSNWKSHPLAREFSNRIAEYLRTIRLREKRLLLEALFETIGRVRAYIKSRGIIPPEGYQLVAEEALEAMRQFCVMGLEAVTVKGQQRENVIARMRRERERLCNLDEEIRHEGVAFAGQDDPDGPKEARL